MTTAAVALGLAAALLLGELGLRAFWPQRSAATVGMFEQDPDAGFRLQANYESEIRTPEFRTVIRTDSEGYRIPADGSTTPPDGRRLLAIGDSFTFGVGVNAEEAFPHLLEGRLNTPVSGPWTVRNGGVGGYGPLRTARLLIDRQGAWRPEIVVHAFYVGNDLEDPRPETFRIRPRVRDGRMYVPRRRFFLRARLFLRTHSHLYSFLRASFYDLYRRSGLASAGQYLEPVSLSEWPTRIRDVGWPAGRDALREIRDWVGENEGQYLVVLVPARHQVDEDSWEQYQRLWDLPPEGFDRDHPQRVLREYLEEIDVATLDLLEECRAASAAGRRLYFPVDRHWTPDGHALAAQAISRELARLGWIRDAKE